MTRIDPVHYDAAEGGTKVLLDAVKATLGGTPNMTTTMARSAVLEGWLGLNRALRKGSISGPDGERIALAVAEANGCSYCLSAHTYLATHVAHLGSDEIKRARQFDSTDPTSAAVLSFTRAVVDTKGQVDDNDISAAHDAGLSDIQLADIVGHVAVNVLTNYFNRAFDVDIDFPVVEPRPQKSAA
jgi:uncharacterized peroxidase-related enzyme